MTGLPSGDLARIVESGPFGYLSCDARGRIENVNATLLSWLGYETGDLCGVKTLQELLGPGDRIYFDTHVRPLLHMGGSATELAMELVRCDGERLPVMINAALIGDQSDTQRIEAVIVDATIRRTYELELLHQRRVAERSQMRLHMLYELVSGFASASTVDEVCAVVTDSAASPFDGVQCHLWLLSPDRRSAVRAGMFDASRDSPSSRVVVGDKAVIGDAMRQLANGELVAIEDVDDMPNFYPVLEAWLRGSKLRSAVVAPLFEDDDLAGVLAYGLAEPHAFDDGERQAVASLATQTEQALRRARLHESETRARQRLENLREFSHSLSATITIEDVAAAITAAGFDRLGACDVRLVRLDQASGQVNVSGGPVTASEPNVKLTVDSLDIGCAAVRAGSLVHVESRAALAQTYPASAILANTEVHRVVAVPLRSGAMVVGAWVIGFDADSVVAGAVDTDDLKLLGLFGDEASHAIRRASFHERDAAAHRRSERRRVISEAFNSAATTAAVGEALAVQGRSAFSADGLALLLLDDDAADTLELVAHVGLSDAVVAASKVVSVSSHRARRLVHRPTPVFVTRPSAVDELFNGVLELGHWGAAAVLPVRSAGRVRGLIVVLYRSSSALDDETRGALSGIAAEASVAIGRARTFDLEREIAMTLQRSLLSMEVPILAGLRVDAWYSPGHEHLVVGGDLFDVTRLADGRAMVIVGDVVGHGLAAAASLGQLRSAAKALSLTTERPAELLSKLDDFARLTPGVLGASVCCAVVDPGGPSRYACAGHPYPILVTDGSAELLQDGRSGLLGTSVAPRVEADFVMAPTSTLVLYTDGVVERRGEPIDEGFERLRAMAALTDFASPRDHARQIGIAMLAGRERVDDAVVVCVTRTDEQAGAGA